VDILAAAGGSTTTTAGTDVEESSELDVWVKILRTVIPEDDDSTFFDDDDSTIMEDLYGAEDEQKQEDHVVIVEDSYEVAPTVLLPLPAVDDKKFPQENKHYFKKKKYVCNDKYGLDKLLPGGMELPPFIIDL
jgi:hypothetical protein